MQVLAIDPGRHKCGVALAIVSRDTPDAPQVLLRAIWPREQFAHSLRALLQEHAVEIFVLGDATTSRDVRAELEEEFASIPVRVVDERNSTLEARGLFWQAHPPRGWRRLVPLSLQNPPRAVDDFAAQVLAIRFARGLRDHD